MGTKKEVANFFGGAYCFVSWCVIIASVMFSLSPDSEGRMLLNLTAFESVVVTLTIIILFLTGIVFMWIGKDLK